MKKRIKYISILLLTRIISSKSYDSYLNYKLDEIEISNDDIDKIDKNLDIFVMNDSQGINLNIGLVIQII
mgnify:CR=1 FL=1